MSASTVYTRFRFLRLTLLTDTRSSSLKHPVYVGSTQVYGCENGTMAACC